MSAPGGVSAPGGGGGIPACTEADTLYKVPVSCGWPAVLVQNTLY